MKAGLVSVSFRSNTPFEIIGAAARSGLSAIEWGSDVHAHCGNSEKLKEIALLQKNAGLECSSYGTYFRIGVTPIGELPLYLTAAEILGTGVLRVWCGDKPSSEYSYDERMKIFEAARCAAETAKAAGMTITADMIKPRLGETLDDIREALSYVDYFFPNFDEACLMTGETEESKVADKLFECGVKNVIMKIGKRGCYIRNAAGAMIVPACKGVTAIDTIGAGDNFASGFISALLQGKDIRDCGIYANCTAAISVQYVGATTGVRNKEMVEEMLEKYKKDYIL